jgi:hypothetical protein
VVRSRGIFPDPRSQAVTHPFCGTNPGTTCIYTKHESDSRDKSTMETVAAMIQLSPSVSDHDSAPPPTVEEVSAASAELNSLLLRRVKTK